MLTAFGVGGATVFGSVIAFLFKGISRRFSDIVLAFAAGVMLAASVWGLFIPALESGVIIVTMGIFAGALVLNLINRSVTRLSRFMVGDAEHSADLDKVMLFVAAIAIHNIPEGIAAGVGFGTGDTSGAILIAGGIALQNVPEGMVIIGPMLAAGVSPAKTFLCALLSGLVEVVGTFLGYCAVSTATAILPFALSFAGGTMLYVIADEMIPQTHSLGENRPATYSFLVGFCFTLIMNSLL